MQQFPETPSSRQTTVLEAMGRYRWTFLLIVLVFAGFGLLVGLVRQPGYEARATLVLEQPSTSSLLDSGSTNQPSFGQYLAEQEELIKSADVAERAAEISVEEDPATGLTADDIWDGVDAVSDSATGFMDVYLLTDTADDAVLGVNSVVRAYEEVSLQVIRDEADSQLTGIDAALNLLSDDIDSVQADIEAAQPAGRVELDSQLEEVLAELVDLQTRRQQAVAQGASDTVLNDIRTELDDLYAELQTGDLYRRLESAQPELAQLLTTKSDLLDLERKLTGQRQLLQIEKELADTGVKLSSPAQRASAQGIGLIPLVVVLAILGAVVGAFVTYYLALRRQRVSNSRDPELVLNSPLLTEIPSFAEERIRSSLPVEEHPESSVAESFRFLASSIVVRRMPATPPSQASERRHVADQQARLATASILAVVSATIGDGKTTLVANAGLAAARAGNRVLLIDADFGAQQLVALFADKASDFGITDVVLKRPGPGLAMSIGAVEQGGGGRLDIMGRGTAETPAGTFFRDEALPSFLDGLRDDYDLVLIDTPPLLQVAYAGLVTRLADEAIVVVRHDSDMGELEELRDRLEMTGTPPLGYAYNGAPLRRRLAGSEPSMSEDGFAP